MRYLQLHLLFIPFLACYHQCLLNSYAHSVVVGRYESVVDWGVVPDINPIIARIFVLAEISDGVFIPSVVYLNLYLVGDIQAFEIIFSYEAMACGDLHSERNTLLRRRHI